MRKYFITFFITLTLLFLVSLSVTAQLVPCGQTESNPCKLSDLGTLAVNVFNFIVFQVAVPLAALVIVVGGIFLLVSGSNPGLADKGKKMLWGAVIGLVLIFSSWIIINTLLNALGYVNS